MMKLRTIVFCLSILLTSIVYAKDVTIGLNPNFSISNLSKEQVKQQIARALEEISSAANVNFKYHPKPEVLISSSTFQSQILGWWSGKQVLINAKHKKWTEDLLYCVMVHEILHSLGLMHDDDPLSMMKPQQDGTMHLGPTDIANLIQKYGMRK